MVIADLSVDFSAFHFSANEFLTPCSFGCVEVPKICLGRRSQQLCCTVAPIASVRHAVSAFKKVTLYLASVSIHRLAMLNALPITKCAGGAIAKVAEWFLLET